MPIFYDPTEARSTSLLSKSIIDVAKPLDGLEIATGADLLVTELDLAVKKEYLLDEPLPEILSMLARNVSGPEISKRLGTSPLQVASIINLWKMTQKGALIQRKSGQDFTNSIKNGKLSRTILGKMLMWTPEPWLLFVGTLDYVHQTGIVTINGEQTGYHFPQVSGLVDAWQRRGGFYKQLSREGLVLDWLQQIENKLSTRDNETPILPRMPIQKLVADNETWESWVTLATFPGIGPVLAKRIMKWCGNQLCYAIDFLSHPDALTFDNRPKGIGPRTIQNARRHLGLDDGNCLRVTGTINDK